MYGFDRIIAIGCFKFSTYASDVLAYDLGSGVLRTEIFWRPNLVWFVGEFMDDVELFFG